MIKRLAVTLTATLISHAALGLTDEEHAALHHIHQELVVLERWIDRAATTTNPNQRKPFQYPQLRADLQAIRQGIKDAVNQTRREPRALPAIKGDY